ncbi:MAG: hypothetical protein NT023_12305 [Armatimonadetes bacterium]|nr:hypothetical protein [Armatimonadota bacterium]
MTQTALRIKTRALAGKRLDITIPELDEGEEVEIIILRSQDTEAATSEKISLLEFVKTVDPGPRPFKTWEEYERALQEEREAWER